MFVFIFFFFFSSRRRHTRWPRDWSSDVCSSDLRAEEILSKRGQVRVLERDYKRYVGAQIGIYNPDGEKVGKVSHLRNREYLFVVSRDDLSERLRAAGAMPEAAGLFE